MTSHLPRYTTDSITYLASSELTAVCEGVMSDRQDWWGYLIFVFFIIVIVIFVIKILLEFPGLTEWKFVFSESEEDNDDTDSDADIEMNEIIEDAAVASKHLHKVTSNESETDVNKNVENAEPVVQSVADRHALISNFMSS